ncbi:MULTISPECIES: zinc ribbon domain-containing protein [Nostocales]|uniref:zinc ribbon domain-containing protein n=1 Tax=Nostocales TaxID=1161 RepID=UPI00029B5B52|nr:protein kinase-like protein [Anabaena sp. 90]MTJ17219.1 hypothetical protein [Dolichospermum sp. UHCC 0299]MTJ39914.1 hypothetical protein [Dolichospermum sp. UHCC 0406]
MTNIYCSQGHQNPSGSRFCLQCGDKIANVPTSGNQGIQPGQTLGDRYVIIRQIGQGGFGKTYLAEDINRFREACVLKEFSPQVQLSAITSDSRRQLGNYTGNERAIWQFKINKINVGSRSLYDLGDAAFLHEFPEQKGKSFIKQPIGQVWYAFVNDQFNAILDKSIFEKIVFPEGATGKTVNGSLQPGRGKVFIAGLAKDQNMEVKLEANSKVLLSIYSPSGKNPLLEDSQKRTISATLSEKGFYEFVVVSTASEPVDYQLTVTAENPPEPEPTETPSQTPTEEPIPTETPTPEGNY